MSEHTGRLGLMPGTFKVTLELCGETGSAGRLDPYVGAYAFRGKLLPMLRDVTGETGVHASRYSITPLRPESGRDRVECLVSLLDDRFALAMWRALETMGETAEMVLLDGMPAVMVGLETVRVVTVDELCKAAALEHVDVAFRSATTFAAGDDGHDATPDPKRILGSWLSVWAKAFPDHRPPQDLADLLPGAVTIVSGHLAWCTVRFQPNAPHARKDPKVRLRAPSVVRGFEGTLKLVPRRRLDEDGRRWITRLARVANYSGTGYRTAIGLGHTETRVRCI